jgi:hypothetical protein
MCLCFGMLLSVLCFAQFKIDEEKNTSFSKVISTVLMDYPYNFKNITGRLELAQAEIENYQSSVSLPGAASCMVTRYHSKLDTTCSWQALLFRSEEFKDAARQYQQAYRQLNNSNIKLVDGSVLFLKGQYEDAKEELDFVTSSLKLQTGDERFKNVKVEVEMHYRMSEWIVYVNVVSKLPDDEVRPDWMEGK